MSSVLPSASARPFVMSGTAVVTPPVPVDVATPAPELEDLFFPQPEWLVDAIHERILPLPGHVPAANFTDGEIVRRARLGV